MSHAIRVTIRTTWDRRTSLIVYVNNVEVPRLTELTTKRAAKRAREKLLVHLVENPDLVREAIEATVQDAKKDIERAKLELHDAEDELREMEGLLR